MNKHNIYIKPQVEEISVCNLGGSLLAASGDGNVSDTSLNDANKASFTMFGKDNNDDDWDDE